MEEGAYAENQVVVLFKDSGINTDTVPKKGDLAPVGASFGDMMDASSSEQEALGAADEEVNILKSSLGSDFVLEDTLLFNETESKAGASVGASADNGQSGEMSVALVSSDKYDTKTLIEKLSGNKNVAAVEPNYIIYPDSLSDYSLNDEYSSYLYHVNSPAAKNTSGESVDDRGTDAASALSVNAASGWNKLGGDKEEIVVAVVDSGVNYNHEDLKDMMWVNPGNIGLKGEHGYNFAYKNDKPLDDVGHGTHCAGIIAAQADNLKGVAGISSKANVKIMALKTMAGSFGSTTAYACFSAFHYIHKAVQAGVNVVASNNSWGGYDYSLIFDELINLLGNDGVVCCFAAGNDGADNDRVMENPANSESDNAVSVGAANINGKPAKFSNYGKASVDVFAPGMNIFSTVSYQSYFPSVYSAQQLSATTEYYGEFNADTQVIDGTITPSTGSKAGTELKPFGALKIVKESLDEGYSYDDEENQGEESGDDEEPVVLPESELELSVEQGTHFVSGNPYRLKITVKNARADENYYIYFPYKKNPLTTGYNNTHFSILAEPIPTQDNASVEIFGGEVSEDENGKLSMTTSQYGGYGVKIFSTGASSEWMLAHAVNSGNGQPGQKCLMSAEEAGDKNLGFGFYFHPNWSNEEFRDVSWYLDSFGISKPNAEVDANAGYDLMSGTSMACPAVTGATVLLASLYPRQKGESGMEYAKRLRSRLFSCVRQTEEFSDLCSTGGYVDLSMLDEGIPSITDAVCDLQNETITLSGENLFGGSTIACKNLHKNSGTEAPLPDGMTVTYAADGSSAVIHNAKSLFSTYTEFIVTGENGQKGTGKFFLVKGQNKLEDVSAYSEPRAVNLKTPYLASDASGKRLFGYYHATGEVSYFDGAQFNVLNGTALKANLQKQLIAEGRDHIDVYNNYEYFLNPTVIPTIENGVIYTFAYVRPPNGQIDGEGDGEPIDDEGEGEPTDDEGDGEPIDDEGGGEPIDDEGGDGEEEWKDPYDDSVDPLDNGLSKNYICSFDLNDENPHWSFRPMGMIPTEFYRYNSLYNACMFNGKLFVLPCCEKNEFFDATEAIPMFSVSFETGKWQKEQEFPLFAGGADFVSYGGKLYAIFSASIDNSLSEEERILDSVYCFDGEKWEKTAEVRLCGRTDNEHGKMFRYDAIAKVKGGLLFINTSVDGGGNVFTLNPETGEVSPHYYSLSDSLSDSYSVNHSCAVTRDGIYYIRRTLDENSFGWELKLLPESSGVYESLFEDVILGDADGDGRVTINDATMIQKYLAEFDMPDSFVLKACDVNGDGRVTISDVTAIQRYVAEMYAPAGIGKPID